MFARWPMGAWRQASPWRATWDAAGPVRASSAPSLPPTGKTTHAGNRGWLWLVFYARLVVSRSRLGWHPEGDSGTRGDQSRPPESGGGRGGVEVAFFSEGVTYLIPDDSRHLHRARLVTNYHHQGESIPPCFRPMAPPEQKGKQVGWEVSR